MERLFKLFIAIFTPVLLAIPASANAIDTSDLPVIGAPQEWGYLFQEGYTEMGDRMADFHDYLFVIITVITIIVLGLMTYIILRFSKKANPKPSKTTHNTLLEVIWTTIPILIVVAIIIPSMNLLYYVDRVEEADLTLKVTGYQWYWGYEYPEYEIEEYESRIKDKAQLDEQDLWLLSVDNPVVLPVGKTVRVLMTGDPLGVIHAWGVPALKFKRDTIPGRTNEGWLKIEKPGIYYGQCYELCGPDHAFMPVEVIAVDEDRFNEWVLQKGGKIPGMEIIKLADEKSEEENK